MLPLGGLLIIIFIGWVANKDLVRNQITNNGNSFNKGFNLYYTVVKFIIPFILLLFVLNLLGIIHC